MIGFLSILVSGIFFIQNVACNFSLRDLESEEKPCIKCKNSEEVLNLFNIDEWSLAPNPMFWQNHGPQMSVAPVEHTLFLGSVATLPCLPNSEGWRSDSIKTVWEHHPGQPLKDERYFVNHRGGLEIRRVQPWDAGKFFCFLIQTLEGAYKTIEHRVRVVQLPTVVINGVFQFGLKSCDNKKEELIQAAVNKLVTKTLCLWEGCSTGDFRSTCNRKKRDTSSAIFRIAVPVSIAAVPTEACNHVCVKKEAKSREKEVIHNLLFALKNSSELNIGKRSLMTFLIHKTKTCNTGFQLMHDFCVPCEPGHFLKDDRCVTCPKNYYTSKFAATSCNLCTEGQGTVSEGSTTIDACKGMESGFWIIMTASGIFAGLIVLILLYLGYWSAAKIMFKFRKSPSSPRKNKGTVRFEEYERNLQSNMSEDTYSTSILLSDQDIESVSEIKEDHMAQEQDDTKGSTGRIIESFSPFTTPASVPPPPLSAILTLPPLMPPVEAHMQQQAKYQSHENVILQNSTQPDPAAWQSKETIDGSLQPSVSVPQWGNSNSMAEPHPQQVNYFSLLDAKTGLWSHQTPDSERKSTAKPSEVPQELYLPMAFPKRVPSQILNDSRFSLQGDAARMPVTDYTPLYHGDAPGYYDSKMYQIPVKTNASKFRSRFLSLSQLASDELLGSGSNLNNVTQRQAENSKEAVVRPLPTKSSPENKQDSAILKQSNDLPLSRLSTSLNEPNPATATNTTQTLNTITSNSLSSKPSNIVKTFYMPPPPPPKFELPQLYSQESAFLQSSPEMITNIENVISPKPQFENILRLVEMPRNFSPPKQPLRTAPKDFTEELKAVVSRRAPQNASSTSLSREGASAQNVTMSGNNVFPFPPANPQSPLSEM